MAKKALSAKSAKTKTTANQPSAKVAGKKSEKKSEKKTALKIEKKIEKNPAKKSSEKSPPAKNLPVKPLAAEEKGKKIISEPIKVEAPVAKAKKGRAPAAPAGASEELKKWIALRSEFKGTEAPQYRMSDQYAPDSPLIHPRLGWGYVVTNQNDRLEVLFESGIKILISNYKQT